MNSYKDHWNDETLNMPEDYELKEDGYTHKAMIDLMKGEKSCPELEQYEEECYQKLVTDCSQIIQKLRKKTEDVIRCWHQLGTHIINNECYQKGTWGSSKIIHRLAKEVKVNASSIYSAIRFADKFPAFSDFEQVRNSSDIENVTWHYIVHHVLPKPKPPKPSKPKIKVEIEESTTKPSKPNLNIEIGEQETEPHEMDITDDILAIADKIDLENCSEQLGLLWKDLLEAVYKYDSYDECWIQALTHVAEEIEDIGERVDDTRFTMEFDENGKLLCRIHGIRNKQTKEWREFDAEFYA